MPLKTVTSRICLGIATAGLIGAAPAMPQPAQPGVDRTILHMQVILDRLGFSPGVIDGKPGQSLTAALTGFQTARGLPATGKADQATLKALYPYRALRPTRELTISEEDARGPWTNPVPKEPADQAKLPALGYRNMLEALAEKFHTTNATLIALNSPETVLTPGAKVVFPNVLPTSRDYDPKLDAVWRATLNSLNVDARQPEGKLVVVDKSEGVLKVYDADDRLVAQFSATMGSQHDPLPIGDWTIKGASHNPSFHYNPDLFWDADSKDQKAKIPPGPNGPVGVIWLDISKPHYGIHGTPDPEKIGRSESHGCIRLTNWDAARLSLMVKPGTPARFQQ